MLIILGSLRDFRVYCIYLLWVLGLLELPDSLRLVCMLCFPGFFYFWFTGLHLGGWRSLYWDLLGLVCRRFELFEFEAVAVIPVVGVCGLVLFVDLLWYVCRVGCKRLFVWGFVEIQGGWVWI